MKNVVLLLMKTIYGLCQAAMAFWRILLTAFHAMQYKCSKADPCLNFGWIDGQLVLWIFWIDDCFSTGPPKLVYEAKKEMMKHFKVDDLGELEEYVGCKIEHNKEEGWMCLTQPVLLQSYADEFNLPDDKEFVTPAVPGQVLQGVEPECYRLKLRG